MNVREKLPLVLIILGALLLVYVSWQYGSMYLEQQRLAREWQRQQQSLPAPNAAAIPSAKPVSADDGLTRLTVPKINLDSVIVEGTSRHALLLGPGHLKDTPVPGDDGNAVISGHRDTFFRHLHELEKGDELLVQRGGRTFHYQVIGKKIVKPTDVSVIAPTKDAEMTLITCYPTYFIGPAPDRLVVFTKLIDEQPRTTAAAR